MAQAAQRGGGPTQTRGSNGLRNPGVDPVLWGLITRFSQRLNLDPYAVAAVSRVEGGGRFGAVGDAGTSYGPRPRSNSMSAVRCQQGVTRPGRTARLVCSTH